jgi:hypothetical protein
MCYTELSTSKEDVPHSVFALGAMARPVERPSDYIVVYYPPASSLVGFVFIGSVTLSISLKYNLGRGGVICDWYSI